MDETSDNHDGKSKDKNGEATSARQRRRYEEPKVERLVLDITDYASVMREENRGTTEEPSDDEVSGGTGTPSG